VEPDTAAWDGAALLERLASLAGVSGTEGEVAAAVRAAWEPLCDEVRTDALGNVVGLLYADEGEGPSPAVRASPSPSGAPPAPRAAPLGAAEAAPAASSGPGAGHPAGPPSLLLAAHLDEIGMVVTKVEDGGFLRVAAIGGVDARYLPGLPVTVHGRQALPGLVGTIPPHLTAPEERQKPVALRDAFVDVGLPEARVREVVRVGDRVTVDRGLRHLQGEVVTGKALDDRASLAALHEALRHLRRRRRRVHVLLVATVQEEVGLRGAATAAYGLAPDVALALDVGFARQPGAGEPDLAEMGKGPVVAQGGNFHPAVVRALLDAARAEGVAVQREYVPANSGTDAWAIQVARQGVPCGLVSLPLRYMHSPVETLDLRDLREAGRLVAAFAASLDRAWVEGLTRVLK
jgi:putative aminopeptidase FrvX